MSNLKRNGAWTLPCGAPLLLLNVPKIQFPKSVIWETKTMKQVEDSILHSMCVVCMQTTADHVCL